MQRHFARELERAKQNGRRERNTRERTRRHTPYVNKRFKAVRKEHKRIRNRRENFVHQETRKLVDWFGTLHVEGLDTSGMLKNGRLAKSMIQRVPRCGTGSSWPPHGNKSTLL